MSKRSIWLRQMGIIQSRPDTAAEAAARRAAVSDDAARVIEQALATGTVTAEEAEALRREFAISESEQRALFGDK